MSNQRAGISSTRAAGDPSTNLLETASDYLVGGGILTMALFPLAIPMVALLIVAALPLLVAGVAVAAVGAVLAAPVLLVRGVWRRIAVSSGGEESSPGSEHRSPPDERRRPRSGRRALPGNRPVMGARG
jgi:hypothetical protein